MHLREKQSDRYEIGFYISASVSAIRAGGGARKKEEPAKEEAPAEETADDGTAST